MKRRLLQWLGRTALATLRKLDYYFTGSVAGVPPEEALRDPYRVYGLYRQHGNVIRTLANRGWMVLGFEEVQALFRDPRVGSDLRKNRFLTRMMRLAADGRELPFLDNPTMLNLDPPDHTRLRKLASQGFLHKFIQSLEPHIESIVNDCLDTFDAETGQYDIISQLAQPLPAIVIAELMGLPESDQPRFRKLSDDLLNLTMIGEDEMMEKGVQANRELTEYFKEIIEYKHDHPGQDLITRLIEAEEEGDRLTAEEMHSTCVILLVAGHETTTRLIGNGMHLLLQHPDQLDLLRADRSLMSSAIEEMLRFEPPVQLMPRFALEDFEFYGKRFRKNQLIGAMIGSANRDPAANSDPDVFDITRDEIRHVSFGHGIHLCLGMNLARLEAKVAFNCLLNRFPDMALAEQDIVWTPNTLVRGMERLVIDVPGGTSRQAA
jgi:cytochrome P450